MKFIEVLFGQRLKAVENHILPNRLQRVIASQTAMEGLDLIYQCKALDHFRQLLERVERAQAIAMQDNLSHQQTAVARQQDTPILMHDLSHICIVIIVLIQAVKSQHA